MRKSFYNQEEDSCEESPEIDRYQFGNLDLLNFDLDLQRDYAKRLDGLRQSNILANRGCGDSILSHPNSPRTHHILQKFHSTLGLKPSIQKLPQGYGNSIHPSRVSAHWTSSRKTLERPSEIKVYPRVPLDDFLYPRKKRELAATEPPFEKKPHPKPLSRFTVSRRQDWAFPFKETPSGHLKINSEQVVFDTEKCSILVAHPELTRVDIASDNREIILDKMTSPGNSPCSQCTAIDTIMSQGGLSTLGTLLGNSPVRGTTTEAMEYKSKRTHEILDPELNLGRLGYNGQDPIPWDRVLLPEKKNLYLELYSRITHYTNADCKVFIDNEEFNCHLLVLQCYSELFDAYIAVKKVELPSDKCSATAFAFIYEWMITGEPSYKELSRDNVLDIFISAKYLKIKDLVEQCWAFIDNVDAFCEDNAFFLYMEAKKRGLNEIRELMLPRIQGFFLILVSSQDWLDLALEDVKALLSSNYICVNCEMEVFMSAVRWLKHDWTNRDKYKYDVLECVRFGNIAPWQLVDIKRNPENPDFMELTKDPIICKMIDDGLAYVIIKYWYGQENDDFQHWNSVLGLQEPPSRNWSGSDKTYFTYREFLIYLDQFRRNQLMDKYRPKMMYERRAVEDRRGAGDYKYRIRRVGGMTENEAALIIQTAWRNYRKRVKKTIVEKPVYEEGTEIELADIFSTRRNEFFSSQIDRLSETAIGPLNKQYITDTSLFFNDIETVLVFGGIDPHHSFGLTKNTGKDIYRYVPYHNHWEYVGELPEPRQHHACQFMKGRVYLVGGADPREDDVRGKAVIVDTVWSFEPVKRSWFSEGSLNTPRKCFGLVATQFCLFAIGGQDRRLSALSSVEKFDSTHGFWETMAPMKYTRMGLACVKYRELIWAAGGLSLLPSGNRILDVVESYYIKANQWTEITRMRHPRCFFKMFVMSDKLYVIGGAGFESQKDPTTSSLDGIDIWDKQAIKWRKLSEMAIPRHGHTVSFLGTQFFIIGGVTTIYMRALSNTECFCVQRGTWIRGVVSLPNPVSGHASVTLPPAKLIVPTTS